MGTVQRLALTLVSDTQHAGQTNTQHVVRTRSSICSWCLLYMGLAVVQEIKLFCIDAGHIQWDWSACSW